MKHPLLSPFLFFLIASAVISFAFIPAKQKTTKLFIFAQRLPVALSRNYDFTLNGTTYKLHTGKTMQTTVLEIQ